MTLRNASLIIAIATLLLSCNESKPKVEEEIKEEIVQKPVLYKYGFDLNDHTIVDDTIKSGETFGKLLLDKNIDGAKIYEITEKVRPIFDIERKLRAGKPYAFIYSKDNNDKPDCFVYQNSMMDYLVINIKDSVYAYKERRKVTTVEKEVGSYINSSLLESAYNAGMGHTAAYQLSQIFEYTVDYFHLQKGDNFKIIYEERYVDDTIYAGLEKIKAAYFEHKGKSFYAFNYVTDAEKGQKGYYDENGNTMKRFFLKAPLDIFRISSRFSLRRFHPVQKRWKGHFGTDYAAPRGTPIRATANGTVTRAGYTGGNGNYVKIRHNQTYETQYLHMSKILVKQGQYVSQGQVIGLVGSTGLATGPHVCYRFWKNGVQVDPLKEVMPPSEPIAKELKEQYLKDIEPLKKRLDNLVPKEIKENEDEESIIKQEEEMMKEQPDESSES